MSEHIPSAGRSGQSSRGVITAITCLVLGLSVGVIGTVVARHDGSASTAGVDGAVAGHVSSATRTRATTATGSTATPVQRSSGRAGSIPPVGKPDPAVIGLVHVRPESVSIPSIKVDSPLVDLGLNSDGSLAVPTDFSKAGWYTGGQYPGDANGPPALIAGHIDDLHGPAVFYRLSQLHVGNHVLVHRIDGSVATFVVYRVGSFLKSQFPAASIYAKTTRPELRLITCTGQFDRHAGSYLSDFVAFARLSVPKASR